MCVCVLFVGVPLAKDGLQLRVPLKRQVARGWRSSIGPVDNPPFVAVSTYIYLYIYIYMYVYIYIYIYIYIYMCICMYIYVHAYVCMYAYIQTRRLEEGLYMYVNIHT